ncbi:hypothetical protein D3C72_1403820 [compost metagenome]
MAIAVAVGGGVGEQLALRAAIAVGLSLIDELRLAHHAGFGWGRSAIAGNAEDVALLKSLRNAGCGITGIQTNGFDVECEPLALAVQSVEIDDRVMHIGRGDMGIGDDGVSAVHRAVVKIEEALRLAVAHHITAVGIAARHLGRLHLRRALFLLQRFLTMQRPLGLDRPIEIGPVVGP